MLSPISTLAAIESLLIVKRCCCSSVLRQTPGCRLFIHGTEFVSITMCNFKPLHAAMLDEACVSLIGELTDVELPQKVRVAHDGSYH
jgi:hypothetical protein